MNQTVALQLMAAANDDPVLASWAAVVHQYNMSSSCDVSPYEHWEAYQELFAYGLISAGQYNNTDATRVFFSGRRLPWGEIQRVLDVIRDGLGSTPMEPHVSKTRLSANPFDDNTTAIEPTGRSGNTLAERRSAALPERQTLGLDMFAPALVAMPAARETRGIESPFAASSSRLACTDNGPSVARFNGHTLKLRLECHNEGCNGEQVELSIDNGQAIGPDDLPGGQIELIDAIFCGKCKICLTQYHCSAGRNVSHDRFR